MKTKIALFLVLAFVLAVAFSACSDSDKFDQLSGTYSKPNNTISYSPSYGQQDNNLSYPSSNNKTETSNTPRSNRTTTFKSYKATHEDNKGYKIEITLTISPWIKTTDVELIEYAWGKIGGKGDPSIELNFTHYVYKKSEMAITFGTISIANKTNGFNFSEDNPFETGFFDYKEGFYAIEDSDYKYMGWRHHQLISSRYFYSSGSRTYNASALGSSFAYPNALMKSDNWGPVPFVMVIPGVFTPNTPNGTPEIDNIGFKFGSNDFTIGKEW